MLNNLFKIIIGTALILMVPLIAMQLSSDVDWSLFDFMLIGGLLLGSGFLYELIIKKVVGSKHQVAAAVVLIGMVALIWVHLAVGIVDTWPFAGS